MSDWKYFNATGRGTTGVDIGGTKLHIITRISGQYNKETKEVRQPPPDKVYFQGAPAGQYATIFYEVPNTPDGNRIYNDAKKANPVNVIDDKTFNKRFVALVDVYSTGRNTARAVSSDADPTGRRGESRWVSDVVIRDIANFNNGRPASLTPTGLAIANNTALNQIVSEDGSLLSKDDIKGTLGLTRSSNPARPDPASPGPAPGPQQQDNSPVLNFDNASLTDIGTPNLESYFPSGVQNNTLRYPYDIIKGSTDYLQISIAKYDRGFASDKPAKLIRATNDAKFKSKEGSKGNIGTIILPIPSNIQDGNSVGYSDGTLDSLTGAVVGGALDVMDTNIGSKTVTQLSTELKSKVSNAFNAAVDSGVKGQVLRSLAVQAASIIPGAGNVTPEQLLARQTGGILNPNMELLFNGVTLRSFKFSFKMTPRNKDEADEIKKIIRTLKINMAPQTLTNDNFLRTPNVFELQYMTGSVTHPFLHRFKTCALTAMSVNYTGEGIYATYGNTKDESTPISMIMDLTFKELEPIYNTDYERVGGVGY